MPKSCKLHTYRLHRCEGNKKTCDQSHETRSLINEADKRPRARQDTSGDEEKYRLSRYVGSFTKTLPHDLLTGSLANPSDYLILLRALRNGRQIDFDAIRRAPGAAMKLVDPQASLSSVTIGFAPCSIDIAPEPSISSAAGAVDLLENYAQLVLRDVPFIQWSNTPSVQGVLQSMNAPDVLAAYAGPRDANGLITVRTLFRGIGRGESIGPYVSQLLLLPLPYGQMIVPQTYKVSRVRTDDPQGAPVEFGVRKADMIAIQNGIPQAASPKRFLPTPHYIASGRHLAEVMHTDPPYVLGLNALQILTALGAAPNPGFKAMANEISFVDRNGPFCAWGLIGHVSHLVLQVFLSSRVSSDSRKKHSWYKKWQVYRRVRPEAFSLLVQNVLDGTTPGNPHGISNVLLRSQVLRQVEEIHRTVYGVSNSYLFSSCYPEGSPPHPSYPSGHACMSGATATILKLLFDGRQRWLDLPGVANPSAGYPLTAPVVEADETGEHLIAYRGADAGEMTVNSELNKYASNVATGRNISGVHYRSDGDQGILLGEKVAIRFMQDVLSTINRKNGTDIVLTLEKFDGRVVHIAQSVPTTR